MDVSKLPRLSKTETPAASTDPPAPTPAPADYGQQGPFRRVYSGRGPEAWISVGIGLILLFAFPRFTQWWVHTVFHTKAPLPFTVTDANGDEIAYRQSMFFFSDLAIASFAYALIVEGIALLLAGRNRPAAVWFALVVTIAAVALNAWYLVSSFGEGLALVSAFAVVLGGYMIWFQWTLARDLMAARRAVSASTK